MFVVFLNKTFRWFKYICIKKWTCIRFLQDFKAWPKCLETGTAQNESARPKRQDRKVAYPHHRDIQAFSFKTVQKQKYTMII